MATEEGPGSRVVFPGDRLGSREEYSAGRGTYVEDDIIYSSLWGRVQKEKKDTEKMRISTIHFKRKEDGVGMTAPSINSIVVGRVLNVNPRFCKVEIMSVASTVLLEPLRGILRREDVRATEKDSVEMYRSFKPKDFIKARVTGLGDAQGYVLSTAENELGVIHAVSQERGVLLIPISWFEMQCPKSGKIEHRKVAKVVTAVGITETDK